MLVAAASRAGLDDCLGVLVARQADVDSVDCWVVEEGVQGGVARRDAVAVCKGGEAGFVAAKDGLDLGAVAGDDGFGDDV